MAIDIRARQFGRHFSTSVEEGPALSVQERRERRARIFAERGSQRALRFAACFGAGLRLAGLRGLFGAADSVPRGRPGAVAGLPDPEAALDHCDGLCGRVDDPTPEGLLEGLARGLVPAAPFGPLCWFSPRVRLAIRPVEFRAPTLVCAQLSDGRLNGSLDRDFEHVLRACGPRLAPSVLHLFAALYDMGFAHSVEIRDPLAKLVGGAWGVALGRVFVTLGAFGARDAALTVLNRQLRRQNFVLHDMGRENFGASLGFSHMARADYFRALLEYSGAGRLGRWQATPDVAADEASDVARVA